MACGHTLVFGHDDLARLVGQVETRHFTAQTLGHKFHLCAAVHQTEVVVDEEVRQDGFVVQANGLEQNRDRHLAAAVHAEVQQVFRVEFKVQPRATVRNDAGREQQFARAVGLALVVLKKHTRRTVQLRHDHALGAVDDERALAGHQRHFAHVDLLLFHFFDHLVLAGRGLTIINDELHLGTHGRRKGQTTGLALAHIKSGLGEVVLKVLHLDKAVVRNDGESRFKRRLQAFLRAFLGGYIRLQKRDVCVFLHLQQVRYLEHAIAVTEVFANSLAFCVCISH